jgi:hypothetical protein
MANHDGKGKVGSRTLVTFGAIFIFAFAIFAWGSGSGTHVASNPGPSGMPESSIVNPAPPPASGPQD